MILRVPSYMVNHQTSLEAKRIHFFEQNVINQSYVQIKFNVIKSTKRIQINDFLVLFKVQSKFLLFRKSIYLFDLKLIYMVAFF